MLFEKLITILPLSRIDPDASELTERIAQATLGSFQALWHPALLSRSTTLPEWARASDPPEATPGQLILIPEPSRRFLPFGWEEQARAVGVHLFAGEETRNRFLARLQEVFPIDAVRAADEAFVQDFLALGLARLWLEMLTAYMKHGSTLDEDRLQKEVLAAAAAAVVSDGPTCENHLRAAFQLLTEAREQLYPVDVHLLDLILLDSRTGMDRMDRQLSWAQPINVFTSGRTIEQFLSRDSAAATRLRGAIEEGKADIIGGEYDEVASTLLPLESHLWQFRRGERSYREVLGRTPLIFGRRRFGLARHVLQLINRLEFLHTTHFCFDDGIYPVKSDPKTRWEAPDSSTVESLARVPFAADNALDFLKFPARLAKTMASDFIPTLTMVHWPMPDAPWYEDLLRIARYSNVFARFTTLSHYFQSTDPPSLSSSLSNDDLVSPFLAYDHNRGSRHPISEFAQHHRQRARFESIRWLRAMGQAIRQVSATDAPNLEKLESSIEERETATAEMLESVEQESLHQLAELVVPVNSRGPSGSLVFNSLSFDRRVVVPGVSHSPILSAEPDSSSVVPTGPRWMSVQVPAMGFSWVPHASSRSASEPDGSGVVVEGQVIRNEFLEIEIDAVTGGIRSFKDVGTRSAEMAQQLVLVGIPPGSAPSANYPTATDSYSMSGYGAEPIKSEMRATATTVRSAGPDVGELVIEGELRAMPCPPWAHDPCIARFRQTYRIGQGQSMLRVGVEILDLHAKALDSQAGPWQSYLASRFAWPDSRSMLQRGVGPVAEASRSQRPESPYFVELHGRRHRTAILSGGLPFHQRIGDRMLDTLLITATEECRAFEFGLGIDLPNPFQAALDLITPPAMILCDCGPPPTGSAGWFFHLDARNVVVTSVAPLEPERPGVRLRMFESAGRYARARLRCLRDVSQARMTDFHGQRLATLDVQRDTVPIDLAPHEITQVEIEFA